jgi:cyclase
MTVEGGIRSVFDAKKILRKGADKIALNTAATQNKNLIKELSEELGSQSVVLSIQAKKRSVDTWEVFCLNGRQPTGLDVVAWAKEVEFLGAGEIILSSVDQDGTEKGMDFDLIKKLTTIVNIPIIASSGAHSIEEIKKIIEGTDVSAVAIGKSLHNNNLNIIDIKKKLNL